MLDVLIVFGAYIIVFFVRSVSASLDLSQRLWVIALSAVLMVLVLYVFGVYQRLWSRTSGHGVVVILNAVAVHTLLISAYALLTDSRPLPLSVVLLGNLLSLVGFVAVRFRSRLVSGAAWRWRAIWHREFPLPRTRVLIVGAGESGQSLAWRLKHRSPEHRYEVVGFIDDDPDKQNMYVEGSRVVGTRASIEAVANAYRVDLIVVAVHNISGPAFREILTACERTKSLIKVVPDLFAMVDATHSTDFLRNVQPDDLIGRSVISRYEAVDLAPVTGKVILITGAAGSIGSELSRQMMSYEPTKAVLLDSNESGLHDLLLELRRRYPSIEIIPALVDVTVPGAVRAVFEAHRPQIVFHAAAYKHVPMLEYYPAEAVRVNVGGTHNLAELALQFAVERFVLISTDKAVNPSSVMGASKRVCELVLHTLAQREDNQTLFTAVRFGNVLGSRGSVVPTFNRQIDDGGPVTVTHPVVTRYFMSIGEAVNLIIHAACLTSGDDIFILQMGDVVRIVELAERMIRMRGLRPYQDIEIRFTGLRSGEKLHEELFNGSEIPMKTIHPKIMRIDDWDAGLATAAFWEQIAALGTFAQMPADDSLAKLRQIIYPDHARDRAYEANQPNTDAQPA
ncbi:MAG: polysaccharide biosynthesis protein [Chloroflexi bacterium]|nr:polysaccharide biosynthesis protein [Chloroflexota bacterium]